VLNVPQAQKTFWAHPMEPLGDVGHVESHFGLFGDMLVSVQDRCTVCAKRTIAQKLFWTHPVILLGDKAQVEARFSTFGDSANLDVRWTDGLCQTYHKLRNHFRRTRWNSLEMWVMWNLILLHLETRLVSVQDRCTVCAKRTIGLEIILDAPSDTPR
jgi:hypothetical protein